MNQQKLMKHLGNIVNTSNSINSLINNIQTREVLLPENSGYIKQNGITLNMRLLINGDNYKIDIYTDKGKRK